MCYLTTSCTNSNVFKMQLHVLSAMLVDSITLLPLCIFSTGYPLSIECSLKFYFSSSKLKMDLLLCIYRNFCSTGQFLDIISDLLWTHHYYNILLLRVLLPCATAHLLVQHPNCGTIFPRDIRNASNLRLPHTSRFFVGRRKIFTCGLVCGEFRQVRDKIGACRAISDSARSQNVLLGFVSYCAVDQNNLSGGARVCLNQWGIAMRVTWTSVFSNMAEIYSAPSLNAVSRGKKIG